MTIEEYITLHGTYGLSVLVHEFIARAPQFCGDTVLARELGNTLADLESALEQFRAD